MINFYLLHMNSLRKLWFSYVLKVNQKFHKIPYYSMVIYMTPNQQTSNSRIYLSTYFDCKYEDENDWENNTVLKKLDI